MPYIVEAYGPDDRSVSKEYFPPISGQLSARLAAPWALSSEERATLPTDLPIGKPQRGGVPDILGWSTGPFYVSQKVREFIEELEPGVQEFIPLRTRSKNEVPIGGQIDHGTYYLILHPPQLDCIVIDETDFKRGRGRLGYVGKRPTISLWPGKQCTLFASIIAGHHFWRGIAPFEFVYFCSDALHDRIAEEGLEGLTFHRCKVRLGIVSPKGNAFR